MPRHCRRDPSPVRRRRVLAVLAAGLVLGVGATVTLAAWNDAEVATGSFAASVFVTEAKKASDPDVGGSWKQSSVADPVALDFNATGLYPDAYATAGIDVRSTSSTDIAGTALLSAVSSTGTTLTDQLEYRVVVQSAANTAGLTACAGLSYTDAASAISPAPASRPTPSTTRARPPTT